VQKAESKTHCRAVAEFGVWDNPRAPQKAAAMDHGGDFGFSIRPLHRLVCAFANPDSEHEATLHQYEIRFIIQNTELADTKKLKN
jgi:hypothetical protein